MASNMDPTKAEEPEVGVAEEHHGSRKSSKTSTPRKKCPVYFGVRSYLHDFYEATYKDPSIYEDDDDFRFLLHPNPRKRKCPPILWRIFMWIGVNLLVFGVIGILVGYLVPQKPIFFKVDEDKSEGYVDHSAQAFNTTLDLCKLIGLILFCVGGITLAMALLLPSVLTTYCDEDVTEETFKVQLDAEEKAPLSPTEMTIPSTSKVKSVQPQSYTPHTITRQEETVEYRD